MSEPNKDAAASRDSEPFLVLATAAPARRPVWRRWLLGLLVLGLAAGGALGMGLFPSLTAPKPAATGPSTNGTSASGTSLNGTAGNGTSPNVDGGEAGLAQNLAGLALQGISLFNGEKGAELWRLKASWAHLSQEGDTILVDYPVVRYTMGDPAADDFLDVKSEKGKVTDNQRYLTLTGNVDVKRFGDTVTGPRLDYDSKTRIMVFPEGAHMESDRAVGDAKVFTWNLETNTMLGEGGVSVLLKPRPASPESDAAESVSGAEPLTPPAAPAVTGAGTANPGKVAAPKAAADKKIVGQKPAARKATAQKSTAKQATTKKTTTKKAAAKKATSKTTPATQPAGTTTKKQSAKQTPPAASKTPASAKQSATSARSAS